MGVVFGPFRRLPQRARGRRHTVEHGMGLRRAGFGGVGAQPILQRRQPLPRGRTAQHFEVEEGPTPLPRRLVQPEQAQRVVQQRQQVEVIDPRADQIEHDPGDLKGRGLVQLQTGGVIRLDPPALQVSAHAGRQHPVGRHQRRDKGRPVQPVAQGQRDGLGLGIVVVELVQRHLLEGRSDGPGRQGRVGLAPPAFGFTRGHLRGQHGAGEQARACLALPGAGPGPALDVTGVPVTGLQKFGKTVLGMGHLTADFPPRVRAQILVQPGQHHRPLRQRQHGGEQIPGRGDGTGRASGDHRAAWGGELPLPDLVLDGKTPARRGGNQPGVGLDSRPDIVEDGQEQQRFLPVIGEVFVLHQLRQAVGTDALRLDLVHEPRQLLRQGHDMIGRQRLVLVGNQFRQHRFAPQLGPGVG